MSDATRNFSLRLSPADHQRLEQVAARLTLDRTAVLRLLIRRATVVLSAEGCFTPLARGRAGRVFPVRLIQRRVDDRRELASR
ncbi:MAG: hypothetical protein IPO91_28985 [Chloroflexi bacterium]|nr:hypothetical protein [Chloroflexota bacterium]